MSRQQIETVEQMRQLPHGTILRELGTRHGDTGYTFTHSATGLWYVHGEGAYELGWSDQGLSIRFVDYGGGPGDADTALPAEVLYRPDEDAAHCPCCGEPDGHSHAAQCLEKPQESA